MKTAEDIVRALADNEPLEWSDDGEYHRCVSCKACKAYWPRDEDHTEACPYRMAREWMAERERPPSQDVIVVQPGETVEDVAARYPGKFDVVQGGLVVRFGQPAMVITAAPDKP